MHLCVPGHASEIHGYVFLEKGLDVDLFRHDMRVIVWQ